MDIEQLIFPFIMAVITNSIMIVIIYFLRKIPYFANLFNVWFMVILYLFCVLRIFLPIEFPGIQIILRDYTVYAALIEPLIQYDNVHNVHYPSIIAWTIISAWIVGVVILSIRALVVQKIFKKYLLANGDYSTDEERAVFIEVARDVLKSDKNVSLRKTDAIDGTFVIGLIHQTVFIPDIEYTENELRMMLRHECMHIKNKDLWIKLLVQIYCCIFWWNPFAYLLKKDLDLTLEMKCDLNTTESFSDKEKILYVETLHKHSVSQKQKNVPFVVSAELVDNKKKDRLLERVKKLLAEPPNKAKQIFVNTIVAILFLLIFASSFIIIWQPNFREDELEEEYYELAEGGEIVDESIAYLRKNIDGNYTFYVDNEPQEIIPKEEVEKGMYKDFPVYEQ